MGVGQWTIEEKHMEQKIMSSKLVNQFIIDLFIRLSIIITNFTLSFLKHDIIIIIYYFC